MNNNQLTIVARILAKDEKRDLVKSELLKLIPITRAEAGCINYDLYQDNENPNLFYSMRIGRVVNYGNSI